MEKWTRKQMQIAPLPTCIKRKYLMFLLITFINRLFSKVGTYRCIGKISWLYAENNFDTYSTPTYWGLFWMITHVCYIGIGFSGVP